MNNEKPEMLIRTRYLARMKGGWTKPKENGTTRRKHIDKKQPCNKDGRCANCGAKPYNHTIAEQQRERPKSESKNQKSGTEKRKLQKKHAVRGILKSE